MVPEPGDDKDTMCLAQSPQGVEIPVSDQRKNSGPISTGEVLDLYLHGTLVESQGTSTCLTLAIINVSSQSRAKKKPLLPRHYALPNSTGL